VNSPTTILFEVCVQSPADCDAAAQGGADRVELCQAIELGGLTPSQGVIAATLSSSPLPVIVLVRPRPGDFIYSPAEVDIVRRDLELIADSGARGAAIGALTSTGDIDEATLDSWVAASGDLELVFHRAFDSCRAPLEALSLLSEHGLRRVLSSGGATTALEGAEKLAAWIDAAGEGLEILPAGSIRPETVAELISKTGAGQVHFRAPSAREPEQERPPLGTMDPGQHERTDAELVRAVRAALD